MKWTLLIIFMLVPAVQLEEAGFANTSHSAWYLHIPEFCDAAGVQTKQAQARGLKQPLYEN